MRAAVPDAAGAVLVLELDAALTERATMANIIRNLKLAIIL